MRGTLKTIRDAEITLLKRLQKGKKGKGGEDALFDPKKPKAVRIYVATKFPEWQETCVQAVKDSYSSPDDKVDDAKVRDILTEKGQFKKRMSEIGVDAAFLRTLLFSESEILKNLLPYLKKSLSLEDVEIFSVDEASQRESP
ncbi:hypothetical protein EDD22DRAFT_993770 [Suillus occidentalis]|nr:hypothetical protein EDD22DRAFT_993770 [Suillus occidentalis]